jgi:glycosyltransferase involved in cell wall biosynthesis
VIPSGVDIAFVFHDTGLTGASVALLRYLQFVKAQQYFSFVALVPGKGSLFTELCTLTEPIIYSASVHPASRLTRFIDAILQRTTTINRTAALLEHLEAVQPQLVYFNTVVCAPYIEALVQNSSAQVVWHIHELKHGVQLTGIDPNKALNEHPKLIANSETTRSFLATSFKLDPKMISVHTPCLPLVNSVKRKNRQVTDSARVVACGTALHSKGINDFVQLAMKYKELFPTPKVSFEWVGNIKYLSRELICSLETARSFVHFRGVIQNMDAIYNDTDVLVSLSHEESFGLTIIEAASFGVPAVGYNNSGEISRLLVAAGSTLSDRGNFDAVAQSIHLLLTDRESYVRRCDEVFEWSRQYAAEKVVPNWLATVKSFLNEK